MDAQTWTDAAAAGGVVTGLAGLWLGTRGRRAATARDESTAAEQLTDSLVRLGKRLDQVTTSLQDTQQRLAVAEQRAVVAEMRAATSEAEVVRLRAEVASLRAALAAAQAQTTVPAPPAGTTL